MLQPAVAQTIVANANTRVDESTTAPKDIYNVSEKSTKGKVGMRLYHEGDEASGQMINVDWPGHHDGKQVTHRLTERKQNHVQETNKPTCHHFKLICRER